MRLRRTRRTAIAAVCAAIAAVCVVVARYTPVGWVLLYAVAGAMTLLSVRLCGFGYGVLTYGAVSLISLAVLPYNLPYVLLIGLHGLLRELLFGKPPRRAWRLALGYLVLLGFFYAMPLAVFSIARDTLGMAGVIEGVGGLYVFCAIAAAALVLYDLILSYLVRGLERAIARDRKKTPAAPGGGDPFAERDAGPTADASPDQIPAGEADPAAPGPQADGEPRPDGDESARGPKERGGPPDGA